jgi:transposase
MKKFKLTNKQEIELRVVHRSITSKKDADKIKAVFLLSRGKTPKEIAEVLMLDRDTIGNYQKRYESGGVTELLKNNYLGSSAMLSCAELEELSLHVNDETYLTVDAIALHIKKTYKIEYSISGLRQLLHRLGFVYKKAKIIPGKANAELQEKYLSFLEDTLKTKEKHDAHYYLDGVHPQHNTQLAYGWIKKGSDKVIKSNTGRKRININGALNSDTLDVVIRTDDSINTQSTLLLFKALEEKHPKAKNIFITLDNARYYKNKLINKYLENSTIKLLFMPPYSPNLNLIERLWKFMKKTILYNQYYEKFSDFEKAIMSFFENIKQYKNKLSTLLTKNFQILGVV